MNARTSSAKPRRPRLLGPATILAIVAAVVLVGAGRLPAAPSSAPSGGAPPRTADELRREIAARPVSAAPPALRKPEPGLLLARADALGLSPGARKAVAAAAARWRGERAAIETEIGATADTMTASPRRTEAGLRSGLGAYSALSRRYDEARAAAWASALGALTPVQRARAEALR